MPWSRRPALPSFPEERRLLRNDAFRRLFFGRMTSLVGDAFYMVAAMWLVYELTGSTAYTGLAGALTRVPYAVGFLVGPVVDRVPLGRVLVLSEAVQGALVLAVPLAAALGHLTVAVVLAVMPLLALSNQFAGPAQTAALPRLVQDDLLVRANSAFAAGSKGVDAVANAVGGAIVALTGALALFVLDAVTFAAAALVFLSMRIPRTGTEADALDLHGYVADLRSGFALVGRSVVGHILLASLLANFLVGVTLAVLPAFADTFGGAEVYGLLLGGMAAGRLVGAVVASAFERVPFGRFTVVGFVLAGLLWVGAVHAQTTVLVVLAVVAARVPTGIYNVLVMATLQTGIPDDMLGRVIAVLGSATGVIVPLGLLLGGLAGDYHGSHAVVFASALGLLLAAAYWFIVPDLRRFPPVSDVSAGQFDVRAAS